MYFDPRIESKAKLITYHIQTNEGIHLSDKSQHDIFSNVRECANFWKMELDAIRENNPMLQLNELKLWLNFNKPDGYEIILELMDRLRNKEYIRDLKVTDLIQEEI
jgi:hypothetical protein